MQIQRHKIELLAIVETLKEFKGMLWGQQIKVFTDHANLMRDALGLTSDQVYWWRSLLEEYGPKIVYTKGIHNTMADAVSRLEYGPSQSNSWKLQHNESQEQWQPETMLDEGLKKVVQARHWFRQSRLIHRQTWWLKSCVCTSQRRGGSIPSYFNRDSRCTA